MSAWQTIKQQWQWRSVYMRYGLRMSIACSLCVACYTCFPITNGYWAAFSVIACVWPTQGMSMMRIQQRFWGTFFGIGVSILLSHFVDMPVWLIEMLAPICIFLMFYLKAVNYALYVFFATLVTLLFVTLLNPSSESLTLIRVELTALGIVIALVCSLCVFPVRQGKQLPCHFSQVKNSLRQYFAVLCDHYEHRYHESLTNVQGQTFKYLQIAQNAVQESHVEWRKVQPQAASIDRLTMLYEKMLCLHIHMPQRCHREDLQVIAPRLADTMRAILPLWESFDEKHMFHINRQLVDLHAAIKSRRSKAALDPKLKAAIFHDYIQWSLFIETLQNLLACLSTMRLEIMTR